MTKQECIDKIKCIEIYSNNVDTYWELYDTAIDYDCSLEYLFDCYDTEESALTRLTEGTYSMSELPRMILEIQEFGGIYYWNNDHYVDADLESLREQILNKLEADKDDEPENNSLNETKIEEVWVEEDDDFLTRKEKA